MVQVHSTPPFQLEHFIFLQFYGVLRQHLKKSLPQPKLAQSKHQKKRKLANSTNLTLSKRMRIQELEMARDQVFDQKPPKT